jgi:hypothetical protein
VGWRHLAPDGIRQLLEGCLRVGDDADALRWGTYYGGSTLHDPRLEEWRNKRASFAGSKAAKMAAKASRKKLEQAKLKEDELLRKKRKQQREAQRARTRVKARKQRYAFRHSCACRPRRSDLRPGTPPPARWDRNARGPRGWHRGLAASCRTECQPLSGRRGRLRSA